VVLVFGSRAKAGAVTAVTMADAVDAGGIDWSNAGAGSIGRAHIDGTGPVQTSRKATMRSPIHRATLALIGALAAVAMLAGAPNALAAQAPTTTTLTSSSNPAASGAPVTYRATVVPTPTTNVPLSGTVTFMNGSTPIPTCNEVQVSSYNSTAHGAYYGQAFCTAAAGFAPGPYPITAVYSGDQAFANPPMYAASTSAVLTQQVVANQTTTALTSSANPVVAGAEGVAGYVTYSAQVSGDPGDGSIGFSSDGTTIPGCGTLNSGGGASCTVHYSTAGSYQITATFSGDSVNAQSTSSPLTEVVTAPATTVFTSAAATKVAAGAPLNFAVTASSVPPPPQGSMGVNPGSTLPAGVAFADNGNGRGEMTGSVTSAGTYQFTLFAVGVGATAVFQQFTLTVTQVSPTVASFTPASAITGSTVTVTGTNFTGATAVKFGKLAAAFTVVSATQITAKVPNGAVAGTIAVTTAAGTAASSASFTPTLSITTWGPTMGPYGTNVTLHGVGFTTGSTVQFNGIAATAVKFLSAAGLVATVPPTATTGPVTVSNASTPIGTVSSVGSYTVTPHVAPTITSFTPTSGITGTSVTITGTNFTAASSVKFGSLAAPYTPQSATVIVAKVPAGAVARPISVTTGVGTATSSTSFTPTLSITSLSPSSGPAGTVVTITGLGFTSTSSVKFNGSAATTVTFVSATQLNATVPATATSGAVAVTNLKAPIGTVTSPASYTVGASVGALLPHHHHRNKHHAKHRKHHHAKHRRKHH
jgi:hypothetical protein